MSDLISRQAAIAEFSCCELTPDGGIDANYAIDFLEQLPPVQPERKTGQWICQADDDIWNCSECDYEIDGTGCIDPLEYLKTYKFCPNCGSYNGGEQTE